MYWSPTWPHHANVIDIHNPLLDLLTFVFFGWQTGRFVSQVLMLDTCAPNWQMGDVLSWKTTIRVEDDLLWEKFIFRTYVWNNKKPILLKDIKLNRRLFPGTCLQKRKMVHKVWFEGSELASRFWRNPAHIRQLRRKKSTAQRFKTKL